MSGALPSWDEQMEALKGVVDRLMVTWRPDGPTEAEVQDMNKLALSILATGYLGRVYTDEKRPAFMPLWNYAMNQGGPDPDYIYRSTEIDPAGTYEITGFRGTVRFVEFTQQAYDIMTPESITSQGQVPASHDLDALDIGPDGQFRVVLSAERPAGHDGDWWQLGPNTQRILMRSCACDWSTEVDPRVAIARLDDGGADMTPEETARRFSDLNEWVFGMIQCDMELVRWYREHHGINDVQRSGRIDSIGGLPTQAYYDGIHVLDDDQAMVVETDLPRECRYWQALVADDRFCTVDWVNRQSSLNDTQAVVDGDGRFRYVVSRRDPGVPNWLDKADLPWGVVQMRFNQGSDYPDPTTTVVPVDQVRDHLPADTPVVTPAERAEALAERRRGALMRRIW